ncbi:MAG: trehalose-phosphatase [Chloroflexi bacterium]|nr:trehalose-phosphatase [Chloroflexota bacterium]MYD47478.1 trehalose-phosphatase [Chloroflexota bacterium]
MPPRSDWRSLLARIANQPTVLLLLDFDGTLSDIVARPEDATLRANNAKLLNVLSRRPGYTVGIISGRDIDDVSQRVGLEGLVYAGNHGLEIRGPGLEYRHPAAAAATPVIAKAADSLAAALADIPGAQVENKTLTLTVHYRRTPEELHERVAAIFREVAGRLVDEGICRVTTAKSALEFRPAVDWHKGDALEVIRRRLAPGAFPIYIGDDATDEDAFRAAQSAGGAGVFVGPPEAPSSADYGLDDPFQVTRALRELAAHTGPAVLL